MREQQSNSESSLDKFYAGYFRIKRSESLQTFSVVICSNLFPFVVVDGEIFSPRVWKDI